MRSVPSPRTCGWRLLDLWCVSLAYLVVHNKEAEIVPAFKNLGTIFDRRLGGDFKALIVGKKAQQCLFLLWKLKSFSVSQQFQQFFYRSYIVSIPSFLFICFYNSLCVKDKKSLYCVVSTCSKGTGTAQAALQTL